jgi:hypothetical protein
MGGDGGTIGASRLYMRGAGTASHTADATRHKAQQQQSESDRYQAMTHCALTGAPLDIDMLRQSGGGVVACPYGRLYNREAALEALLTRRTTGSSSGSNNSGEALLGDHVRGMKDLYPVRFEITTESKDDNKAVPICPVTRTELNGTQPAILVVQKNNKKKSKKSKSKQGAEANNNESPNVLCERVVKEMGLDALQAEYGPFGKDDIVKLAPPTSGPVWEEIKEKVYQQQHSSTEKKPEKGGDIVVSTKNQKDKKHKRIDGKNKNHDREQRNKKQKREERNQHRNAAGNGGAVDIAKANAASAVASSAALSSLFTASSSGKKKDGNGNGPTPFSQGLRNNDLFAR